MLKARWIQKISPFRSAGNFPCLHVSTALNKCAFRIHKCYTIKTISSTVDKVASPGDVFAHSS